MVYKKDCFYLFLNFSSMYKIKAKKELSISIFLNGKLSLTIDKIKKHIRVIAKMSKNTEFILFFRFTCARADINTLTIKFFQLRVNDNKRVNFLIFSISSQRCIFCFFTGLFICFSSKQRENDKKLILKSRWF